MAEIANRLNTSPHGKVRLPPMARNAGLSYVAMRLDGGKDALMELARLSEDERMQKAVDAWDRLSASDQVAVRLEMICEAAELSPSEFVGEIARAAYRWNMDVSTLIAMLAQPRIVEKMTELAEHPDGHHDRKMLLQSSGFLPLPKGARTTIHVSAQAAAIASTERGLPSFADDVMENVKVIRGEATPVEE